MLGSVNLTSVSVKGVAAALEKHTPKGESKGIKAYFRMDENGILNLEKVRYIHYSFVYQLDNCQGSGKTSGNNMIKKIVLFLFGRSQVLQREFSTSNYCLIC